MARTARQTVKTRRMVGSYSGASHPALALRLTASEDPGSAPCRGPEERGSGREEAVALISMIFANFAAVFINCTPK
jgi:hypothetical protein